MTYIKKITMHGFKSFGDRTVSIRLAPGFTCIVGPNGAGKSNVIDALCFCLGRISKKTMRAKSLSDLIFAGTKSLKPSASSTVSIIFDNTKREFPVESDELEISRSVKTKGGSTFRINGKTTTREQLLNTLAQGNIDPDGSNQFVLQGKIVELTHMNTVDRRKFIETLIGLEKYDQMKENTFKELEKAEKDLGRFEAIFKEVSNQLKKYEKEKNDALRWKDLDNQVKQFNAQLIAIKIEKLRTQEEELENQIEEIGVLIQDLEQKQARQREKIEQENLIMSNFEDTLNERNTEKDTIDAELTTFKSELSAKETELRSTKDNIVRSEERKEKLLDMQEPLEDGITYETLMDEVVALIDETNATITETHQAEDETESQIREKEDEIANLETEKGDLNQEISTLKQNEASFKAEIKALNKNLKKFKASLKSNKAELKSLKKEDESIEDALKSTQDEFDQVNQKISELKTQIDEENNRQKELENEISSVESERSAEEKNVAKIEAEISSIAGKIDMLEQNNVDLEAEKVTLREEYERLAGEKGIEDAVEAFKKKENEEKEKLEKLRSQLDKLNNAQKQKEQEKSQIELKRRSLENEITDYRSRLSGLQSEINLTTKTCKTNQREKTTLEMSLQNLKSELERLVEQQGKAQKNDASIKKRLEAFHEERNKLLGDIKRSEDDYEVAQQEVEGVLQILQILSQEIGGSIGEIKSDIQNASETSINNSITNFRDYIEDFMDVLKPLESMVEGEDSELKVTLMPVVETLKLFTEGFDDSLRRIILDIRESNDIAVQESTGNFDNLISDFIDIIENVHVSLRRLTLSKSTELRNQVEEIAQEIQSSLALSSDNSSELSKLTAMIESKTNELNAAQRTFDDISKKLDDSQDRIKKGKEEQDQKTNLMEEARKNQEGISDQEREFKEFADTYWGEVKKLNAEIETQTEALAKVQDDLRELRDVERYLDDITKTEEKINKNIGDIETKQASIEEQNKAIETVNEKIKEIEIRIDELKGKKDEFWQIRKELDDQIEAQNGLLNEATEKISGLQTVQRIINEIASLNTEIEEAEAKVEENKKEIEVIEENIAAIEAQITEKEAEITAKRDEKESLQNRMKELRSIISETNIELQKHQNRLGNLKQMKERSLDIENIDEEINTLDILTGDIEGEIQELYDTISAQEEKRTLKIEEIQKVTAQRDESWERQKQLREELSDITASLSAEGANLETSKNKQETITEKIEELFEQSKQYGVLPPPPPSETDESLIGKIQKANADKKSLEPVNLKAIEYYDEVRERFDEIDMRRQTLQRERKAILDSIDRIELEKTRTFMKSYHEINRHFSQTFQKLSPGGSAKMILDRPESPFEGGITIEARPRGKKISSLDILSGGEKTLVALSFIFAVQTQFPAPFFVLDEIDAALDGPNVHRVSTVIREFSSDSQFIVISHREENIMNSEMIYGVSQTDGLTSIFSVDLQAEQARIEE